MRLRSGLHFNAPEGVVTIRMLTPNQAVEHLAVWQVGIPSAPFALKRLYECLRTHLMIYGDTLEDNEIGELPVDAVLNLEIPEWIIECRQQGLTEPEIQTIINTLGRDTETIFRSAPNEIYALPIALGSIRRFIAVLNQHGIQIPVAPPPPPSIASSPPVPPVNIHTQGIDTQSLAASLSVLKPDPQVIEFVKGEDMIEFINKTKSRLAQENVDDATRYRCFRKSLAHEILAIAESEIGETITDYHEYVNALINAIKTPVHQYSASFQLKQLRYNLSEHPSTFIQKLKKAFTKAVGTHTPEIFLHELMSHIPQFLTSEIFTLGYNGNLEQITTYLIRKHFEYTQQQANKSRSDKTHSQPKVSTVSSLLKKPDPRYNSKPYQTKPHMNTSQQSSTIICNYCKKPGHTINQCRTRPQNNRPYNRNASTSNSNSASNSNANQNQASSSSQPLAITNTPANSSNLTIGSNPNQLPPEPTQDGIRDSRFSYTLHSAQSPPIPMLTHLGESQLSHMPTAVFKLCRPNKEIVREGKVLLDTGSAISALDSSIAEELGAHIVPYSRSLKGIAAQTVVPSHGFAYAVVKHPKMAESRVFRLQIVKDFEPVCLIGNAFLHLYYMQLKSDGNDYITTCSEYLDSTPLDPNFYFRFCTSEETQQIFATTSCPTGNESDNYILDNRTKRSANPVSLQVGNTPAVIAKCDLHSPQELIEIQRNERPFKTKIYDKIDENLPDHLKHQLADLIDSFQDTFAKSKNDLGLVPSSVCPISIDLDGQVPETLPYNCPIHRRNEFKKIIDEMIANDIIEESNAPGGSPAILVPKPDKSYRMVIDYRKLNRLTRVPRHPMPRIDDCLEVVRNGQYFNIFDLAQGYHQIELPPEERIKTVFVTPDGKYHYKRLPMGLASAPFIFQKLMNKVLEGLIYQKCIGYFDDVPIVGKDFPDLLSNTEMVLKRLRQYNLKVKLEKCQLGYTEILLLGHLVSGQGIRPDPKKVEALKNLPYPRNVRELQSILGCYNYFSRYIPNYSTLAAPLYRLISKEKRFRIMPEDKKALDTLKNSLISTTLLVHYDPKLRHKIAADASDHAVGGILQQEDANSSSFNPNTPIEEVKDWLPLSFYSQKLQKHQKHYSVSEKELLAIFVGINKFNHFLEGEQFLIETDHHALCQLTKVNFKNSRLQRWSIMLSTYDFKVVYKQGSTHPPDCFSRYQSAWSHRKIIDPEEEFLDRLYLIDYISDPFENRLYDIGFNQLCASESDHLDDFTLPPTLCYSTSTEVDQIKNSVKPSKSEFSLWKEKVREIQTNNPNIQNIIKLYKNNDSVTLKRYVIKEGLLYRKDVNTPFGSRLVIDSKLLKDLFSYEHESPLGGHFGPEKTYFQIARRFWCQYLYDLVKQLCDSCTICQISKPTNVIYVDPSTKPIPNEIFERLELDVQGPIVINQVKKYIIVLVDILSRYVFAKLTTNQTASTVISLLTSLFQTFGFPKVIQTDQGTNFTSEAVHQFLKENGIKHEKSNPYHPQSQGIVERCNRTIAERLRSYVLQNGTKNLKNALEASVFAINTSIHKITRFTPYFLVFGRHPRKPIDNLLEFPDSFSFDVNQARKLAYARLHSQQIYQINRTKALHQSSPYREGDFVFVKNESIDPKISKKLREKYHGPYLVCGIQKGSLLLLELEDLGLFSCNVSNTKLYRGELTEKMKKLKNQYFNPDTFLENEDFNIPDSPSFIDSFNENSDDHSSDIQDLPSTSPETDQNDQLDSTQNQTLDAQNSDSNESILSDSLNHNSTNNSIPNPPLIITKNPYNLNKFLNFNFEKPLINHSFKNIINNENNDGFNHSQNELQNETQNLSQTESTNSVPDSIQTNSIPYGISNQTLKDLNSNASLIPHNLDYIQKQFNDKNNKKPRKKYITADRAISSQNHNSISEKRLTRNQAKLTKNLTTNTYVLFLCYFSKDFTEIRNLEIDKSSTLVKAYAFSTNSVNPFQQGERKIKSERQSELNPYSPSLETKEKFSLQNRWLTINHRALIAPSLHLLFTPLSSSYFTLSTLCEQFSFVSISNLFNSQEFSLNYFKFIYHLSDFKFIHCFNFKFNSFKFSFIQFQLIQKFQVNSLEFLLSVFTSKYFHFVNFNSYSSFYKLVSIQNSISDSSISKFLQLFSSLPHLINMQTNKQLIKKRILKSTLIERILPSGETEKVPTPPLPIRSPSPSFKSSSPSDSHLVPSLETDDPTVVIMVPRPSESETQREVDQSQPENSNKLKLSGKGAVRTVRESFGVPHPTPSSSSSSFAAHMLPPPPPKNQKFNKDNFNFDALVESDSETDDELKAIRVAQRISANVKSDAESSNSGTSNNQVALRNQSQQFQQAGKRPSNTNYPDYKRMYLAPPMQARNTQRQYVMAMLPELISKIRVPVRPKYSIPPIPSNLSENNNSKPSVKWGNPIQEIKQYTRSESSNSETSNSNIPNQKPQQNSHINLHPKLFISPNKKFPEKYLKPSEYNFKPHEYPAPLPTAPLPHYLSNERFFEVKEIVQAKAKTFSDLKIKFESMIREKIFLNLFDDEKIKIMPLNPIPHGITKAQVKSSELDSIEKSIRCYLCEQISIEPKECRSCKKWYCSLCIGWLRDLVSALNLFPLFHPHQFLCLLPECVQHFAFKDDYPFIQPIPSNELKEKYNKLQFLCRRNCCDKTFPPHQILEHEKKCRLGLFLEEFDFNIELPFVSTQAREELVNAPKRLANFLPTHLKTGQANPPPNQNNHENKWYDKFNLWACLSNLKDSNPSDPLLQPSAIRSIANFSLNFWNNYKRIKDPSEPLDEDEDFIQNVVGFEPTIGNRIPSSVPQRPHTVFWSRVPFYLINDSEEWLKIAVGLAPKYVPRYNKDFAPETSHQPLGPFVRIDPLERIPQERREEIINSAKYLFPTSFKGFTALKESNKATTNIQHLQNRHNKAQVQFHEFNRLTVINMPRLRPSTENLIQEAINLHPSPATTYSIHMAYCRIQEMGEPLQVLMRPRPVWVVIVDGYRNIVFESFVSYPYHIHHMDTHFHGLTHRDIKNAKNFESVRNQILEFFLTATSIIGSGLINLLRSLDLTYTEIENLKPKLREITQYFSPYREVPASLSLTSFLLFPKFVIRPDPHSPALEAITAMNMYLAFWEPIEEMARIHNGIHFGNIPQTCGNTHMARLFQIYDERVRNRLAEWPTDWTYHVRKGEPRFNQRVASPAQQPSSNYYDSDGQSSNQSTNSQASSPTSESWNAQPSRPCEQQSSQQLSIQAAPEIPLIDLEPEEPNQMPPPLVPSPPNSTSPHYTPPTPLSRSNSEASVHSNNSNNSNRSQHSNNSARSVHSNHSNQSQHSNNSNRSVHSNHSNRSAHSTHSQHSNRSLPAQLQPLYFNQQARPRANSASSQPANFPPPRIDFPESDSSSTIYSFLKESDRSVDSGSLSSSTSSLSQHSHSQSSTSSASSNASANRQRELQIQRIRQMIAELPPPFADPQDPEQPVPSPPGSERYSTSSSNSYHLYSDY
uniref:RNA-directed DNA polymerase n=1 Tax=Tetranychus urticae TaxID=32264 RepID=A0A158P4I7_TETUR